MKLNNLWAILVVIIALVGFIGCKDEKEDTPSPEEELSDALEKVDQQQLAIDLAIIDDSLKRWSVTPQIAPHGVRYVVHTEGTGPKPTLSSRVVVSYVGKLLTNASVFERSTRATLPLSGLLIGWQTTLPLINEGSVVTLYIPSGFAYGSGVKRDGDGNISIPANSNLVFEITILDVL